LTGEDIIFTIGQTDSNDGSGSGAEEGIQVISAKSIVTDIADVSRVCVIPLIFSEDSINILGGTVSLSALFLFIYNVAMISSLIQRGDTPDTAYPVLSHIHFHPCTFASCFASICHRF